MVSPSRSDMSKDMTPSYFATKLPGIQTEAIQPWDLPDRSYYDLTPEDEITDASSDSPLTQETIHTDKEPIVAVIGVGYVGEQLVANFSTAYEVIGYDVSESRIRQLKRSFEAADRIRFTRNPRDLTAATHFLISVPTLLLPDKTVDSSFIRRALMIIANYARRGSVIVIESSVAVGMTRKLLGPLAKECGYFAGMSPERVDPGRLEPQASAIPKVVSGLDDIIPGSLDLITKLYAEVFDRVVPVSCPEVAEMTKLYENCQRMVCIAYANEMADACQSHGIDPFEVCRAASTKPFGYMPITPGIGVGGHCIPVNPYYLLANNEFPLLEAASESMRARPATIAQRAVRKICSSPQSRLRPRVLVVGIGFKPGQSHLANSPGLALSQSLVLTDKVDVAWLDPLVAQEAVPQIARLDPEDWTEKSLEGDFDMVIVAIRQHGLDFAVLETVHGVHVEWWCQQ
ncbi:helicase swr1 [Purpureocillium lavendulum]|uniref:Helicase swr1 n=1 Tax=Purpureocillium lavendulum TaxID=1247861 RepID=A0AB34FUK7_9HYPO|nr:helicase swr1 [Purpureocillium lavendulum]